MTQAIIYENGKGGISIIHPAPNSGLTVQQVAAKDVPTGSPYKIVESSTLPTDRTFRAAWEWDGDLANDNDGVGA